MKKIKAYIIDMIFITITLVCLMIYAFSSPDQRGGRQIFTFPEYESEELLANEQINMVPAKNIAALFPVRKSATRIVRAAEPRAAEKPVVNSTYLKYVSSKVDDNGKRVYIFLDNTIMRLYEFTPRQSVNGLKLTEVQDSYFLIEDSESIQKIKKE